MEYKSMSEMSDHDLLIELRGDVKALREEVKDIKDNVKGTLEDHDKRILALEIYRWKLIGINAAISFILVAAGVIAAFLQARH